MTKQQFRIERQSMIEVKNKLLVMYNAKRYYPHLKDRKWSVRKKGSY